MGELERVELTPGYSIAPIINGCWQLAPDHGGGPPSREAALCTFAELVEHGFTTFDCADIYAGTEELLGRFRRTLADPDSIQIHTKYVPDKASLGQICASGVDEAVEHSLERLRVERLDLLQFHWWSYDVPGLELVTERLIAAQDAGKIRHLGVTNFDAVHVRRMIESGVPLVSLQAQYSLLDRRPEKQMTDLAARSGIRLLPYGTLAGGFLSDRYLHAAPPTAMNRSLKKYRPIIDEAGGWDDFQRLLRLLRKIADKHGTTIAAVAARWVLDRPSVAAIILGIGSTPRAREHMALVALALDDEDRRAIDEHLESQPRPRGDMYELERDPDGPHAKIIKTDLRGADEPASEA